MKPEELREQYAYLDHAHLGVFLWEFIRRNWEYRKYFDILKKQLPNTIISVDTSNTFSLLEVKLTTEPDLIENILKAMGIKFGIVPNPRVTADSKGYLPIEIEGTEYFFGIPDPYQRYCDLDPVPIVRGSSPVSKKIFKPTALKHEQEDKEKFYKYASRFIDEISPAGKHNTLFLGVNLHADKGEVMEALERIVDYNLRGKPIDVNKRFKEWKLYLIYYDRYRAYPQGINCSYKSLTVKNGQLFKTFKKNEIYQFISMEIQSAFGLNKDVETIRKGLKKIIDLISADFSHYLYL